MRQRIRLVLNESLVCAPGTFGARLYDRSALHVPLPVYRLAVATRTVDGEAWVFIDQILRRRQDACARALGGWSESAYRRALAELGELLREHLPNGVLDALPSRVLGGGNER